MGQNCCGGVDQLNTKSETKSSVTQREKLSDMFSNGWEKPKSFSPEKMTDSGIISMLKQKFLSVLLTSVFNYLLTFYIKTGSKKYSCFWI